MIKDKALEKKLEKKISELERLIDYIGPTPLRHYMSKGIVDLRYALRNFKQED